MSITHRLCPYLDYEKDGFDAINNAWGNDSCMIRFYEKGRELSDLAFVIDRDQDMTDRAWKRFCTTQGMRAAMAANSGDAA
jgi:hypothetical protein